MSEPYLIVHLVRGQPAFDIAERVMIGEEEGWIIPTSGHRARPFWSCTLAWATGGTNAMEFLTQAPEGWPDHYPCNDRPSTPAPKGDLDLKELGLL